MRRSAAAGIVLGDGGIGMNILRPALILLGLCLAAQAQVPRAAHKVGEQSRPFDGGYGYPVYPLGDATLCPSFSSHTYSYTVQFSVEGDMVFTCGDDPGNPNLYVFPVYDKDFRLVFKDAVGRAGLGSMGSHNFSNPQFSQKRRVIFAQNGMRIYELDPWNRKSRVYVDFGGVTLVMHDERRIKPFVARDFKVGPNDEIIIELGVPRRALDPKTDCPDCYEQFGVATFDPKTGKIYTYATRNDGRGADYPHITAPSSGFDESNLSQDGRVYLTYENRPSWGDSIDFRQPLEFREPAWPQYQIKGKKIYWEAHGHMGFFLGSNGKSYVVKPLSDLIDDNSDGTIDRVGMIGTAISGRWRAYYIIANTATGKAELLWGLSAPENQWGIGHFSRSQASDVFWGSSTETITRYEVAHTSSGELSSVTGTNVAKAGAGKCGYWDEPRVTSDPTGNRGMFDSALAGNCKPQVYVVVYSPHRSE